MVAGCGGGSPSTGGGAFNVGGPSMCGQVAACGGDLTGTWSFGSGCVTSAGIKATLAGDGCPGETAAVTALDIAGSMTFNDDMTYSIDGLVQQGTYAIKIPSSCLGGASCDYAATELMAPGEFATASCTGSGTCSCTAAQSPAASSDSGTYVVSGTTFTMASITGANNTVSYCVQGPILHLVVTSTMTMGGAVQLVVESDAIGLKQQ
jgi:hypothetical protein